MIKGNVKIDHKNLISILQSCLVLILVILVALMMVEIGNLKGTARVINYAGLVRGDTQRAVKLEITGTRNDELIAYLDDILSDLTSGDGHYELVKLKDAAYQDRLDIQRAYWERLKAEVAAARQRGYENTQIVAMSETYFEMADETVSAAEHYSEKIAMKIRTIEILSALDMLCLVILVMLQTAMALKMARKNQLLEQKAYIDIHTGLPNKGSCMEPGFECRWQDKHGWCAIHCQLAALQRKQDEAFCAVSLRRLLTGGSDPQDTSELYNFKRRYPYAVSNHGGARRAAHEDPELCGGGDQAPRVYDGSEQ